MWKATSLLTDIAIQVDTAKKRPADAGKLNPIAQRKRLPPQSPAPPQSSLLRKLLAKDSRVERSHLLQAFRFMENHGYALMCFLFPVLLLHASDARWQDVARLAREKTGVMVRGLFHDM